MNDRRPNDPDAQVLSESARERVLRRASELDDARSGTRVADLRAAAAEAGISPSAFDEAVAELQVADGPVVSRPSRRSRARSLFFGISGTLMALLVSFGVLRMAVPVDNPAATAPRVEQSFVLHCLSAGDAAQLVRTHLGENPTARLLSRGGASRILTVRGTAADIERVSRFLEENDGAGSAACAVPPATTR